MKLCGQEWKMTPTFQLPGWRRHHGDGDTGGGAYWGKEMSSLWGSLRLTAMLVGHQEMSK